MNEFADDKVKCPRCGSTQIHAEKRGWTATSGLLGSSRIRLTCLKCGATFLPGKPRSIITIFFILLVLILIPFLIHVVEFIERKADDNIADGGKKVGGADSRWVGRHNPQFTPDQIADELKKEETKKPPTKLGSHQAAALLDRRHLQRHTETAGTVKGTAAQLSQSETDALRARLFQCWTPPPGVAVDSQLYVVLRVVFKPDGSLAHEPGVIEDSSPAFNPALSESAKRALMLCQPFTMLRPEHYNSWKEIEIKFNNELLHGTD